MIRQFFLFYRAEGTQSNMKKHGDDGASHLPDPIHQLGGEVQSRSGGGGGSLMARVHGLIPLGIFQMFCDVGRQGHGAQLMQCLVYSFANGAVYTETDHAASALDNVFHLGRQKSFAEGQNISHLCPFAGAGQCFPHVVFPLFQKKQLAAEHW